MGMNSIKCVYFIAAIFRFIFLVFLLSPMFTCRKRGFKMGHGLCLHEPSSKKFLFRFVKTRTGASGESSTQPLILAVDFNNQTGPAISPVAKIEWRDPVKESFFLKMLIPVTNTR